MRCSRQRLALKYFCYIKHVSLFGTHFCAPFIQQNANFGKLKGEPCPKSKRDADAEAFCHRPGEPCSKAKRAADAIAAAVAEAQPNPNAFLNTLALRDAFPDAEAMADAGIC